jgi:plasmid maintenance system antidote protein VapI
MFAIMQKRIDLLKGLHPGIFLERELKNRKLSNGQFDLSLDEYSQNVSAIIDAEPSMNIPLAMKIEKAFGWEEGFLMTLQLFYDIKQERHRQRGDPRPDLSKLRPALFWDTIMEKIDWTEQKRAVIERVFERGDEDERAEIIRFYGQDEVDQMLSLSKQL